MDLLKKGSKAKKNLAFRRNICELLYNILYQAFSFTKFTYKVIGGEI